MEPRKLTKADIDKVRHIEGFPNGQDEDIIALSDAPYYTACPNPFIAEFIAENGTPYVEGSDDYHCEPFAVDVSEGKNDPVYNAHSYHTKVPYKAIMHYILHYTKPGDIVFDGFSGSGMTGVACQKCGSDDITLRQEFLKSADNWGARYAVLNDLSPAAAFITSKYNSPVEIDKFMSAAEAILGAVDSRCGWMYRTRHTAGSGTLSLFEQDAYGRVIYTVWSDVFVCPHCGEEIVFWNVSPLNSKEKMAKGTFRCESCGVQVSKKECTHAKSIIERNGVVTTISKQIPVWINYEYGGKRYEKAPDQEDLQLIEKINSTPIEHWFPTDKLPDGYNTEQPIRSHGVVTVDLFYTKRNIITLSNMYFETEKYDVPALKFWLTSLDHGVGKRVKHGNWSFPMSTLSGTLYIPSLCRENNPMYFYETKARKMAKIFFVKDNPDVIISTQSSTDLSNIPNNSIDYIFVDPPFGSNLNYSELSCGWESWLKVKTHNAQEAIMNSVQGKGLVEYQGLIEACFANFFRILKPGRWITVEFHNSKNSVWNAIQQAINKSGFVMADVRILDKQTGSHMQVTSSSAVQQDLVISAYKPKESFAMQMQMDAGTVETAWNFVNQHLANLPVVVVNDGKLEVVSERQAILLFDRMVAYHLINGLPVPLDATDFYKGLDDRYLKRDGMYFLSSQVNEYDMARATCEVENIQFSLLVSDEKSAIGWLYQQLNANSGNGSQTYAELMPKFMQELKAVDKREKMPELMTILEENFLKDEKGRWYIPDLTKSGDIAKLREKNLLKEFQQYMESKGKLKVFRSEAIRAGFAMLWKEKNYAAIVAMAERLPEETIQEDSNLLMYYDISLSRV